MSEPSPPVWTVVYVTANRGLAEELRSRLLAEGMMVRLREPAPGTSRTFELLVPEAEAEEASEILSRRIPR